MHRSDLIVGLLLTPIWLWKFGLGIPNVGPLNLAIGVGLIAYACLDRRPVALLRTGMILPFVGSEIAGYLFCLVVIPFSLVAARQSGVRASLTDLRILLLFAWSLLSYFLSQAIEINLTAFLFFAITFWSPVTTFLLGSRIDLTSQEVCALIRLFAVGCLWQTVFFLVQPLIDPAVSFGVSGDWASGSTRQPEISYLFGSVLVFSIVMLMLRRSRSRVSLQVLIFHAILVVAVGYSLYLASTRVIVYSLSIACGLLFPILALLRSSRSLLRRGLVVTASVAVLAVIGSSAHHLITKPTTTWGDTYLMYVDNPKFNHKYLFLKRAFFEIHDDFGTWLTGTGPGTIGSRASNSRAFDTLHKRYGSRLPSFVPAFTSRHGHDHFSDLYTLEYASYPWASPTLASPFSSSISLSVELGLVGVILGGLLVIQLARSAFSLAIRGPDAVHVALGITALAVTLAIPISSIFDTYLERPLIMIPFWTFSGLILSRRRLIRRDNVRPIFS